MVNFQVGKNYELYLLLSKLSEVSLNTEKIDRLKSFPLDLSLKDTSDWDELVLKLVGSWNQKSGELVNFRFLINNNKPIEEFKKVGSWDEKSGELLKKRGRILLSTLLLTILPASLEELAEILGYKSKERYRDDYVKPLKDNGLIEYTLEQANDPNQQYQITQRGINFLVGSPI